MFSSLLFLSCALSCALVSGQVWSMHQYSDGTCANVIGSLLSCTSYPNGQCEQCPGNGVHNSITATSPSTVAIAWSCFASNCASCYETEASFPVNTCAQFKNGNWVKVTNPAAAIPTAITLLTLVIGQWMLV